MKRLTYLSALNVEGAFPACKGHSGSDIAKMAGWIKNYPEEYDATPNFKIETNKK